MAAATNIGIVVATLSDDLTTAERACVDPELLKADLSVHLLPCAVDHTGPTAVSTYFHPTIETVAENHLKAKFRGRSLEGSIVQLPKGYVAAVVMEMSKKKVDDDLDGPKELKVVGTFDQLHCWNLDKKPSDNDSFSRALQWISVAEVLHKPVECDDDSNIP